MEFENETAARLGDSRLAAGTKRPRFGAWDGA